MPMPWNDEGVFRACGVPHPMRPRKIRLDSHDWRCIHTILATLI